MIGNSANNAYALQQLRTGRSRLVSPTIMDDNTYAVQVLQPVQVPIIPTTRTYMSSKTTKRRHVRVGSASGSPRTTGSDPMS